MTVEHLSAPSRRPPGHWCDVLARSAHGLRTTAFGIAVIDPADGNILALSPHMVTLLGSDEVATVADIDHAGILARPVLAELTELARSAGAIDASWRRSVGFCPVDGERTDGDLHLTSIRSPDLTDHALIAMLTVRHERQFVPRLQQPPDSLMFVYNADMVTLWADPRISAFGMDPQEQIGLQAWMAAHPEDIVSTLGHVRRLIDGTSVEVRYSIRVIGPLGEWTPVHIRCVRLAGDEPGYVAIIQPQAEIRYQLPSDALTSRELAIIGALFNGMRIGQIAARDGVSPKTVRNQLSGVFAKLGVASQTELLDAYDAPPR